MAAPSLRQFLANAAITAALMADARTAWWWRGDSNTRYCEL